MRRGIVFTTILIFLLMGFIYAESDNNSALLNQSQEKENETLNEQSDEDNDNNVTIDDMEDDNETDDEDESRVCCMVTKTRTEYRVRREEGAEFQSETEIRYRWAEQEDCVSEEAETREIVDDDKCLVIKEAIRERNRLRFEERTGQECVDDCICTGRVIKCQTEGGREMTIYTSSGNIIVQVKGVNASTQVTLYHHSGKTFGNFTDGEHEVNIMPDQVKERIRERLTAKFVDEETEIELQDDGSYKFKTKKRARLFFVIPVKEDVEAEIDAETGQFFKFKNGPWWGFLTSDVKE